MRLALLLLGITAIQEPPARPAAVEFTGKPIHLDAVCRGAEIDEFGLSCSDEEACPVYLDLTSVEPAGARVFIAGNLHTESATLGSILLASDDEGRTWTEPWARQRAATLEHLQFVDFETGWVSGHSTGPLLRNPFLLRTSDGGKTWKRFPVLEEDVVGVVDSFSFESRERGALVVDRIQGGKGGRYQRFESMNGGESWMLREVSMRAPAGARSRGASNNADWRIRADAASKTFRVERRREGRWSAFVIFSIQAGACKP
jgi:photosystem II stability/assembly factor-like uncharacterized protein